MIVRLVWLAALLPTAQVDLGAVTAVRSDAVVERAGGSRPAAAGDRLFAGDRLQASASGGASAFLRPGHVLYLGPGADLVLLGEGPAPQVRLLAGESRIVAGRDAPLSVFWEQVEIRLQSAVLRFAAGAPRSSFLVERGQAVLHAPDGRTEVLPRGQEFLATADGIAFPVLPGDEGVWTIDPAEFRIADARQPTRAANQPGETAPADRSATPTEAPSADQAESSAAESYGARGIAPVSSLTLGALSGASFSPASGGLFTDAANSVADPVTRHFVELVTAESRYTLGNVALTPADAFPQDREYWSIGLGAPPTGLVQDVLAPGSRLEQIFRTTDPPTTIAIPGFGAYLLRIDQIANDPALTTPQMQSSLPNLKESVNQPVHPVIAGATPLLDERAAINDRLTFGLGEFVLQTSDNQPLVAVRRSDQDRRVLRNPNLPGFEVEQFNPQVEFQDGLNAQGRVDRIPVAFRPAPTIASLGQLRKAALTTLMADRLSGYAARTGQTRFVMEGKIIDITGYRPPP